MPQVRDILSHVSVETAQRTRICHRKRNEHSIQKSEKCLVINDPATGGGKNYCKLCAPAILSRAKSRIADLESELS